MIVFSSYVYNKSLVLTILQGSRFPAAASFMSPQEQVSTRMSRGNQGELLLYPGSLRTSSSLNPKSPIVLACPASLV